MTDEPSRNESLLPAMGRSHARPSRPKIEMESTAHTPSIDPVSYAADPSHRTSSSTARPKVAVESLLRPTTRATTVPAAATAARINERRRPPAMTIAAIAMITTAARAARPAPRTAAARSASMTSNARCRPDAVRAHATPAFFDASSASAAPPSALTPNNIDARAPEPRVSSLARRSIILARHSATAPSGAGAQPHMDVAHGLAFRNTPRRNESVVDAPVRDGTFGRA